MISRSTFDLQPVLDILIENATRLCDHATQGVLFRFDGAVFRPAAFCGTSSEYKDAWQQREIRPGRGTVVREGWSRTPDGSCARYLC